MFGGLIANVFGTTASVAVGRWLVLLKWAVLLAILFYAVTAWFRIDALAIERDQAEDRADSLGATVTAMSEQKLRDDATLVERERARMADRSAYQGDIRRYRLEGKDACLNKPVDPAVDELLRRPGAARSVSGSARAPPGPATDS